MYAPECVRNPVFYRVSTQFSLDRKVYKGVLTIIPVMIRVERGRPAIDNTSGFMPDSVSPHRERTAKSPSFYLRMALRSKGLRQRERRLIESLLKTIEGENQYSVSTTTPARATTLLDYLISENEEFFIEFIEDAMFSNQEAYEEWFRDGYIIEDKSEGARSVFRELLRNKNQYRLVLTMKNKRGSGVVFKDILNGKVYLPVRWSEVKGLPAGKFVIAKVREGRIERIIRVR